MKLKFFVQGGKTLTSGTSYVGKISGFGIGTGSATVLANDHKITGVAGQHIEFSGSEAQIKANVLTLTGENIDIPTVTGGQTSHLFNGAYSARSFYDHGGAISTGDQDNYGNNSIDSAHKNNASGSLIDGIEGN